jgi:hypothetical protein
LPGTLVGAVVGSGMLFKFAHRAVKGASHVRSFSRSISLRAEEIEQRFRNGVQCAKNAYLTTDDSRLVFGPGAALIRGLTTVSISRPQFSHDQT